MHVQVYYQGLDNTPWMDQFITSRVNKLDRFLNNGASIQVNVKELRGRYTTTLAIHNTSHDYAFSGDGNNLFESFSQAIDKATRSLSEHKRKIKDKINRRYTSLRREIA